MGPMDWKPLEDSLVKLVVLLDEAICSLEDISCLESLLYAPSDVEQLRLRPA